MLWGGKKGLEANYILYVYLWHIFIYWFYVSLCQRLEFLVISRLSQELEENKRLPGIQLAAERTKTHMMSHYLQLSRCPASLVLPRHNVAADAPAAARHLKPPLWQPGLTPAAPPLHLPHLPPLPLTIRESSPQPRHPRHHHPPALKAPSASAWRRASLSAAQLRRPRMDRWEHWTNPATAHVSSDCCCT